MDPLTALGLASNIIQVVDFSTKLVSKGYNIYKSADGSLAENVDAEAITRNLTMLTTKLRHSFKIGQEGNGNLSDDDQSLTRLCEKCTQIADELLHKLDQAKVTGRHRKWKSARQALKSVTSKSDLEQFAITLQLYRSEITLHITISLR
jgi:hypothetical protein